MDPMGNRYCGWLRNPINHIGRMVETIFINNGMFTIYQLLMQDFATIHSIIYIYINETSSTLSTYTRQNGTWH